MSRAKTKVTPHPFQADPETPGDPISGEQVCRCGLVGLQFTGLYTWLSTGLGNFPRELR